MDIEAVKAHLQERQEGCRQKYTMLGDAERHRLVTEISGSFADGGAIVDAGRHLDGKRLDLFPLTAAMTFATGVGDH